jgi:hypothetical protein
MSKFRSGLSVPPDCQYVASLTTNPDWLSTMPSIALEAWQQLPSGASAATTTCGGSVAVVTVAARIGIEQMLAVLGSN